MSSESRIWEIRPFGSMRGGRVLVIGLVPFNPTSPAYSTEQREADSILCFLRYLLIFKLDDLLELCDGRVVVFHG